jgi:hypothetical protein
MVIRQSCWEFWRCGREPGGSKVDELGICPAAVETLMDGTNSGRNGGRICWAIAGTLCGGEVQTVFAEKIGDCVNCAFHQIVLSEEEKFIIHPNQIQQVSKEVKEHIES